MMDLTRRKIKLSAWIAQQFGKGGISPKTVVSMIECGELDGVQLPNGQWYIYEDQPRPTQRPTGNSVADGILKGLGML